VGADALLLFTDTDGVLGDDKRTIPALTTQEAAGLVRSGVARDGMEPKLSAACHAVRRGVRTVQILPARSSRPLSEGLSAVSYGTRIQTGGRTRV
ncbi:MAG: amino acid kinase family protein, partial [Methanobacteriota archaeon]